MRSHHPPLRPYARAILAGLTVFAALGWSVAQAKPFILLRSVGDARMIIDPSAIEADAGGATRRMWTVTVQGNILNEAPPQPGYVRALNEYDCAGRKSRWRSFTAFSRAGDVLLSRDNASGDWTDVTSTSGTLGEWRVACGLSRGDSAVEADSIAKVVIALMRAFDPALAPPVRPAAALPSKTPPATGPKAP